MLLEIKMPPFLFGGCVLVGQIYFVYVKGFVGLYDCRTGGHIPFNVKSVFLVEVGKVFVVRVLRYIVLIAEKGAHAAQLQNTFSSVHNCDFVLCHQLFATMSSDEFKDASLFHKKGRKCRTGFFHPHVILPPPPKVAQGVVTMQVPALWC